jgi:hypothetical protein
MATPVVKSEHAAAIAVADIPADVYKRFVVAPDCAVVCAVGRHLPCNPLMHHNCPSMPPGGALFCSDCTIKDGENRVACPMCRQALPDSGTRAPEMVLAWIRRIAGTCSQCAQKKIKFGDFPSHLASHCTPPCPDGCGVKVSPANLKAHQLASCTHHLHTCSHEGCQQVLKGATLLARHLTTECNWRILACAADKCTHTCIAKDMPVHEATCIRVQLDLMRSDIHERARMQQQQGASLAALIKELEQAKKKKQQQQQLIVPNKKKRKAIETEEEKVGAAASSATAFSESATAAATDTAAASSTHKRAKTNEARIVHNIKLVPPKADDEEEEDKDDSYEGFRVVATTTHHRGLPIYVARNKAGVYIISLRWICNSRLISAFSDTWATSVALPDGLLLRGPIPMPRLGCRSNFGTLELLDYVLASAAKGLMDCSTYSIRFMDMHDVLVARQLLLDTAAEGKQPSS